MGAVRIRVQTADQHITVTHTTPVHQLTSGGDKRCVFVRNKSGIKMIFNSKFHFWMDYFNLNLYAFIESLGSQHFQASKST